MARATGAPRILVVDDEESVRFFAEHALRRAGYEVTVADDGPEALQLVDAQPAFDLFVIDVQMPGMRGDELARRLRRRNPDVKVLYFTGFADMLFEEKPQLWEHEAFVEKPVTINGLCEAVSLLLFGKTRREAEQGSPTDSRLGGGPNQSPGS
jgi:two-component system cell cycle sensor histidine kinase/response regulator CckA